jgi:hypothetical protein
MAPEFVLLVVCLLGGMALKNHFPEHAPASFNAWILKVALPAMILWKIPSLQVSSHLWLLALAPWGVFLGAWLVFGWRSVDRGSAGALILTAGLGNTAFIGLVLVPALLGQTALPPAVFADQFGSFLALSTVGVWVAATYSGDSPNLKAISYKVFTFPPFLALWVALLLGRYFPPLLIESCTRLAGTLAPLALFSVGLQLQLTGWQALKRWLGMGLLWKLALAPALTLALGWLFGVEALLLKTAVLQAAMAPMISGGILAVSHRLNPPLANAMVGLGIPLSFITVPLWAWGLNHWL